MPTLHFTDLGIQKLVPGLYFDDKTPGFGLRVQKNRKTWLVVKGKNRTKVKVGHYPMLSLGEARRKAQLELASPSNPRPSLTFPEAKEAYLAQNKWRPRSKKVLESSLRHFDWRRPLDKITHEDVAKALDAIDSPSARAHALKDIRSLFNWAVPRYLSASPAAGLKMAPQKARSRVLTDEELRRVWITAGDMGTFGVIVKLLLLTGQRKSEIGGLKKEWINQGGITLPAEVTKNGREHSFPLGSSASGILSSITVPPTGCLFRSAASTTTPYNGFAFHLKQLQKASETSDWTLHDLRRTFATGLASLGVPIHVTEKLLNHVSGSHGGIVGVYQRFAYWEEQKDALAKWEEKIQSLVRPV